MKRFILFGSASILLAVWFNISFLYWYRYGLTLIWSEWLGILLLALSANGFYRGKNLLGLLAGFTGVALVIRMVVIGSIYYLPVGLEPYRSTFKYFIWWGIPPLLVVILLINLFSAYYNFDSTKTGCDSNVHQVLSWVPLATVSLIFLTWIMLGMV